MNERTPRTALSGYGMLYCWRTMRKCCSPHSRDFESQSSSPAAANRRIKGCARHSPRAAGLIPELEQPREFGVDAMDCPHEKDLIAYAVERSVKRHRDDWELHLRECEGCREAIAWIEFHLLPLDEEDSSDEWEFDSQAIDSLDPRTQRSPSNAGKLEKDDSNVQLSSLKFDLACLGASTQANSLGRLGDYEILEVVGQGGMGVVFRAFDSRLDRQVAIKVLPKDLADNAVARRRFRREARAASAVSHPNVISIFSVEEIQSVDMIVMEYVAGKTLRRVIRDRGELDPMTILSLTMQIASGLSAAHKQGVIHRDVKPSNIMLEGDLDRVKLTDFGLARISEENSDLTQTNCTVGTPAFMAPEQLRGESISPSADLFALGCVMYAMATGRSPFHGATSLEISFKVTNIDPPPLHEVNQKAPKFLSMIIERLLEKEPEKRFQSMDELLDMLQPIWTEWRQADSSECPSASAEIDDRISELIKPRRQSVFNPRLRSVKLWVLILVVLAILGLAASLPFLLSNDQPETKHSYGLPAPLLANWPTERTFFWECDARGASALAGPTKFRKLESGS